MRGSSKKKRGNWFSRMWKSVQRSAPKVYKEVGETGKEVNEAVEQVQEAVEAVKSADSMDDMTKIVVEVEGTIEEVSEAVEKVRDMSTMTRGELRSVAKKRGIKKWYDLNKRQLLEALSG